ncbi:hypothetical protein PQX77_019111 [Marasmius sp. AFHP31]|nr:hypothetical protein PQX77_019111 [Marasmius sp. AFHP31]
MSQIDLKGLDTPSPSELQTLGVQGYDASIGASVQENCCIGHSADRVATRPRNLVVCIDGTTNKFGRNNSNVVELYSRLVKDESQITYYNSGIGTYPKPSWKSFSYYKKKTAHVIDMAIAWWFEKRIMEAYRWLSENYKKGDRIFLFGFSRGAYQVRVLSAMITTSNLRIHDIQKVDRGALEAQAEASHFKKTFNRDVKVHFVGVWDTVSSVGLIPSKPLPLTTTGMNHVCIFRHALALDEWRVKFVAEYANGCQDRQRTSVLAQSGNLGALVDRTDAVFPPQKKEVWFAGTHSDIGGGNTENRELTSNGPALRWMIRESIEAGLSLAPFSGEWGKVYGLKLSGMRRRSLSPWIALEILPERMVSHSPYHIVGDTRQWFKSFMPHLGRRRQILEGQLVHQSVYALDSKYTTRLPEGLLKSSQEGYVEPDGFDAVASEIDRCVRGAEGWNTLSDSEKEIKLQSLISSKDGRLAFLDLYESLKMAPIPTPGEHSVSHTALAKMKILCAVASHFPKNHSSDMPLVVTETLRRNAIFEDTALARNFIEKYSHAQIFKICLDAHVESLALSRGGSFDPLGRGRPYYLAVASAQTAIPVYDLSTGRIVRTLRGHTNQVTSVSFSPKDSNFDKLMLVSGSMDGAIRAWDVARGSQWISTSEGHNDGTLSVSFSSDAEHIVSSGLDCSCKLWKVNRDTRKLDPSELVFHGHGRRVFSVTVSPDSSRLVSVSNDDTIRLWDYRTGTPIGRTIQRGPNDPREVRFLREGYFLSATSDGVFTARRCIDGSSTSELYGTIGLFQGVTLRSFDFCRGQLACGLSDGRIAVWTVNENSLKEGRWEFHAHHTYDYHLQGRAPSPVTTIAYSDDLRCLVTGYADGYVVVWHAQGMNGVLDSLSNGWKLGPQVIYSQPDTDHRPLSTDRQETGRGRSRRLADIFASPPAYDPNPSHAGHPT